MRAAASCDHQAARGAAPRPCRAPRTAASLLPFSQAARNRSASPRRQKKHGRCPAANAVASSRKNSSVQLRPPITSRRRPLKIADAGNPGFVRPALAQQRLGGGIVNDAAIAGEQATCRVAMMSPKGVTRFCSGIRYARSFIAVIPGRCEASNPESRDSRCAIAHLRSGANAPSRNDSSITPRRRGSALERQRGIPRKENPGVLRHLGDESIDQRTPHRLAYTVAKCASGSMSRTSRPVLPGVHEIVDDQQSLAGAAAEFRRVSGEMPLRTFNSPCLV